MPPPPQSHPILEKKNEKTLFIHVLSSALKLIVSMCALQLFSRRLLDLTDFCPQKEGSTQKRKRSHKRIEYYPTLLLMREWSWMLGQ